MFVDFNILNQLGSPSINSNTFANRPAAGQIGRLFVSTDTFEIYRDNGTTWDLIGGPGSSTITGSGTVGTIPLWTSTSAIGDSDLRQLSSQALILNSATNDWPTSQSANDAGRILLTSVTNNPTLICWGKNAFGSGDEQGTIVLGNVTALGTTTIGGAFIDGFIENNTDGAGSFQIKTTNTSGNPTTALTINSSQISTFTNNVIVNSPGRIGIGTATPGAALDVHSTGVIAQFNTTSATGNVNIAIQRNGTGVWRIGDTYNGGSNFFELHNTALANNAIQIDAATNKSIFTSIQNYVSGLARANYFDYTLNLPNGTTISSPNAVTTLGATLNLNIAGSATLPNGARSGMDVFNGVNFTSAGTFTINQASTIRAFSNLTSGWAFNGSAVGTITHLAGLRILFPTNSGSAINVTDNYALLINNQNANTGTINYTNRWGIYQEGASDLNYMAANLLLGSTVNTGDKLQVTGTSSFTGRMTAVEIGVTRNGSNSIGSGPWYRWTNAAEDRQMLTQLNASNGLTTWSFDGTNWTERFTLTNGGNVGIGTTSPAYKLQVTEGSISFGGADKSLLKLVSGTTTELNIIQRNVSGFTGSILSISDALSFETSATERMRITSGGNVLIGTQTTTANGGILELSAGITFPATQVAASNANTLDDYEEGTWTPVLEGSTTAGSYTYDTDRTTGKYIKIGNQVYVVGVYRVSTVVSAGTGDTIIKGLPFQPATIAISWDRIKGNMQVQAGPTLTTDSYFCFTEGNVVTNGLKFGYSTTSTWASISVTDADEVNAIWWFNITYPVA